MSVADYSDPEAVRSDINDWVDSETEGHIPALLREGQLTARTVLTVVNAIYFKADWEKAFDPDLTTRGTFRRADMSEAQVQMMTLPKTNLRAGTAPGGTLVELPYRGGDISFLAYLPELPTGLPDLEASLEQADLSELVANLPERETVVQMPRFSLRSRFDLIPILQALGVVDLFDGSLANLSKIDPQLHLHVDPFVHEAIVQVDERGTVAAAATAAVVQRKSAPQPIRLDHPFVFFIRDNLTGALLFTGRVADPE